MSEETKQVRAENSQFLTFEIAEEKFGIDIPHVREIIEYGGITKIPMMPDFIRGVLNLRGNAVPVIDLAVRFGNEPTQLTRFTCIVILEVNVGERIQEVGIMADVVNEVMNINREDIEPPPEFGDKINTDFINGMGKVNSEFIILLNANKLLNMQQIAFLKRAAGAGKDILNRKKDEDETEKDEAENSDQAVEAGKSR